MPTKVILQEVPAISPRSQVSTLNSSRLGDFSEEGDPGESKSSRKRASAATPLRSTILRKVNAQEEEEGGQDSKRKRDSLRSITRITNTNQDGFRISSTDIRASPRLLGYVYIFIASAVMLATIIRFFLAHGETIKEQLVFGSTTNNPIQLSVSPLMMPTLDEQSNNTFTPDMNGTQQQPLLTSLSRTESIENETMNPFNSSGTSNMTDLLLNATDLFSLTMANFSISNLTLLNISQMFGNESAFESNETFPSSSPSAMPSFQQNITSPPDDGFVTIEQENAERTRVLKYKFIATFFIAAFAFVSSSLICLVHFDTIVFPKLWRRIFHDGSRGERNLLLGLLFFWTAALHFNTSSFSVGTHQANVYFTTWIAWLSCLLNYEVWRAGADLSSLTDTILHMHLKDTTTTYAWSITCAFSLVVALAVMDIFANRDQIVFIINGNVVEPVQYDWIRVICLTWGAFVLTLFCVFANHHFHWAIPIWGARRKLRWCHLEGIILVAFVGLQGYLALFYTGVQGPVNGIDNSYLGIWGAFTALSVTLGTWLKVNQGLLPTLSDGEESER